MIDQAKKNYKELDVEMGDFYLDFLKVSDDIFGITDDCQINE